MDITRERAVERALRLLDIQSPNHELKAIGYLLAAMLLEGEKEKEPEDKLTEVTISPAATAKEVATLTAKFLSQPTPETFTELRNATSSWLNGSG